MIQSIVERMFKCTLDQAEQMEATTLRKFIVCAENAVYGKKDPGEFDEQQSLLPAKEDEEKPARTPKSTTTPKDRNNMTERVRNLVANVIGLDANEIGLDAEITDYGIDSLMGMELGREVERAFACTLDQTEQMSANTLRKFVVCVENALARAKGTTSDAYEDEDEDEDLSGHSSEVVVDEHDADSSDTWSSPISTPPAEPSTPSQLALSASDILESFGRVKLATDEVLDKYHLDQFERTFLAGSNRLCTALIVKALNELGCPLRQAVAGQQLTRVRYAPQHAHLGQWLYDFLEKEARLVDIDGTTGQITRTWLPVPSETSHAMLPQLLAQYPAFATATRLTHHAGQQLAWVLGDKTDGHGHSLGDSDSDSELMAALYTEYPFFRAGYDQMCQVIKGLLERVTASPSHQGETFKILEVGTGTSTGGLTLAMASLLASLDKVAVEYTFIDASPAVVTQARRRWERQNPFMRFVVHDIADPNTPELHGQHLVLANTFSLSGPSFSNIRHVLQPDGFLLALQMTQNVPWASLVWGDLSMASPEHWERELHAAGFGHVDWTDGTTSANIYQKVMIAMASGHQGPQLPKPAPLALTETTVVDHGPRTKEAERLVGQYANGWATRPLLHFQAKTQPTDKSTPKVTRGAVVVVTGATGSLGSHIIQKLAEDPSVAQVVCINRESISMPVLRRQQEAFHDRGIKLTPAARSKLRVLGTDTAKPHLGLPVHEYNWLVQNTTHIIHNAWPMSWTRPVSAFAPQLQSMRNLLDLAREAAISPSRARVRVGFQFVSSIGVVGGDPTAQGRVLEDRLPVSSTVPIGYAEAKWICEALLDETLHQFPSLFRAQVTRPGQIAGSSTTGYWNPVEHLPFVIKSAQTLRAWPDLHGIMQWVPVDLSAAVMADLILNPAADHSVYHVDNPVGQSWQAVNSVMVRALGIPDEKESLVPLKEWVRRVRTSPLMAETDNPAARPGMPDWLETNFERLACGGLILDTKWVKEHSGCMARDVGPVSDEVVVRFVDYWKKVGFLH